MDIKVYGSEEPYRVEAFLNEGEELRVMRALIGGTPTTELMGDFAVRLTQRQLTSLDGLPNVRVHDKRSENNHNTDNGLL